MLARLWTGLVLCLGPLWGGVLFVSPSPVTVAVGDTVNLMVDVGAVTDLFAYQFDVHFDASVLQALSVTEGSYLNSSGPTLFFPGTIDAINGFIFATAGSLEGLSGVSGSGSLATFSFQAIAVGSTAIDLQNVFLLDSTLSGIAAEVSAGNVTVNTPEPGYALALWALAAAAVFCRARFQSCVSVR